MQTGMVCSGVWRSPCRDFYLDLRMIAKLKTVTSLANYRVSLTSSDLESLNGETATNLTILNPTILPLTRTILKQSIVPCG